MHVRILLHEYGATIRVSIQFLYFESTHPPSRRMLGGLGDEDLHGNSGLANMGWALSVGLKLNLNFHQMRILTAIGVLATRGGQQPGCRLHERPRSWMLDPEQEEEEDLHSNWGLGKVGWAPTWWARIRRSWMLDPEQEREDLPGKMGWVPICWAPLPLVSIQLVGEGGEDLHDNWDLASTELARDDLQRT